MASLSRFLAHRGAERPHCCAPLLSFENVSEGKITVGETLMSSQSVNVPPEKRKVGIVFQNYALWPHMTVSENVGYSLKVAKIDKATCEKRIKDALELVDLVGLGDRRPANLSGGQRQRVALARCLVSTPSLVLFDEPLANLDVHLRASMEEEFAEFHKRTKTTIVYITHDQAEAMALADRIAVMDHGKLIQFATPRELYQEPRSEMVAAFIAQGMVLPAKLISSPEKGHCKIQLLGQDAVFRCASDQKQVTEAKVCIRSSDIEVVDKDGIAITVKRVIYRGGGARIDAFPVSSPDLQLTFDVPDPVSLAEGETAHIRITSGWVIPQGDAQ